MTRKLEKMAMETLKWLTLPFQETIAKFMSLLFHKTSEDDS